MSGGLVGSSLERVIVFDQPANVNTRGSGRARENVGDLL
jgi:hypothetical protein